MVLVGEFNILDGPPREKLVDWSKEEQDKNTFLFTINMDGFKEGLPVLTKVFHSTRLKGGNNWFLKMKVYNVLTGLPAKPLIFLEAKILEVFYYANSKNNKKGVLRVFS